MELPHLPRAAYGEEMRRLEAALVDMASSAEAMVGRAVDALVRLDLNAAREVMRADDEIDAKDLEIESRCLRMLALQQPMGSDLREIGTAMKINTDIERVGDLAVDVAKIALKIDAELGAVNYVDIPRMSNLARQMFRESIQAFIRKDVTQIQEIVRLEDEVDDQYRALRDQVHEYMRANPEHVVSASWMILAIQHIERIADHALNIAERVQFMVTGTMSPLGDPSE